MDNSISMTRALPASTPLVDAPARQPAAPSPERERAENQAPAPALPEIVPEELQQEALETRLERVRDQISEFSRQSGRELEFQVQNDSGRVVILVKSSDTGEVLREIPPEEAQRLSEALASGEPALVDLRA